MNVNWELWADLPTVQLWEAVSLSLEIEPKRLLGYDHASTRDPIFRFPFAACSTEFKRRLEIATRHLGGSLAVDLLLEPVWESKVKLHDVSCWAAVLHHPWSFPEDYPKSKAISIATAPVTETAQNTMLSNEDGGQRQESATSSLSASIETERNGKEWIPLARRYGKQFLEAQAKLGAYPNQVAIGDHVAKRFQLEGIKTETGKAPTGSYIKRYALRGIRSL